MKGTWVICVSTCLWVKNKVILDQLWCSDCSSFISLLLVWMNVVFVVNTHLWKGCFCLLLIQYTPLCLHHPYTSLSTTLLAYIYPFTCPGSGIQPGPGRTYPNWCFVCYLKTVLDISLLPLSGKLIAATSLGGGCKLSFPLVMGGSPVW
jgi:hypothetical protein